MDGWQWRKAESAVILDGERRAMRMLELLFALILNISEVLCGNPKRIPMLKSKT